MICLIQGGVFIVDMVDDDQTAHVLDSIPCKLQRSIFWGNPSKRFPFLEFKNPWGFLTTRMMGYFPWYFDSLKVIYPPGN